MIEIVEPTRGEIAKDLVEIEKNYLFLCRYHTSFTRKNFIQTVLKLVSPEPLCLQHLSKCQEFLTNNYEEDSYLIMAESIVNKMDENGKEAYRKAHLDEDKIKVIEDYLSDRLVIIRPKFTRRVENNKFYKNGYVHDFVLLENPKKKDKNYQFIPFISDRDTIDNKFLRNEIFALKNYSFILSGAPHYLLLAEENNKYSLVKPKLEKTEDAYFWRMTEDTFSRFSFEKKIAIRNDDFFLIESYNTAFIDASFIHNHSDLFITSKTNQISNNITDEDMLSVIDTTDEILELERFLEFTKNNYLCYSPKDIFNFHTCLKCQQLTILAGMSGTGKTKLPYLYKQFFNLSDQEFLFVPISPSYTEPVDILGYLHPNQHNFVPSETGVIELLKHAQDNPDNIHMILFDEMNLAQIEYWFAPFISILEKDLGDRKLNLYNINQECNNKENYPPSIEIGNNVIFVGTINLDETTKNISDRILDRAFIINLQKNNFTDYSRQLQSNDGLQHAQNNLAYYYKDECNDFNYIEEFKEVELIFLDNVHKLLNDIDSQNGVSFRMVKNIATYLKKSNNLNGKFERKERFDLAFKQTIIKKISGSESLLRLLIGDVLNEDDLGKLGKLLAENNIICEFKETKAEIKNKKKELGKYGYTR